MSRQILGALTFAVAAAVPVTLFADQQKCRSAEALFQTLQCMPKTSRPWQIDFGKAKLPPPPPVERMTHHGLVTSVPGHAARHGAAFNPSGSGLASAFLRGLKVIAPPIEKAPIDCAMVKPGNPNLDPKMVRQVHGHVRHTLVIVPVAPCK